MEAVLPIVRQAAAQLADAKQAWLRRWEQSAVQLAVKIAERSGSPRSGSHAANHA